MKKMQFGKRIINVTTTFEELSNKQIIRWADLAAAQLTHSEFNVLMFLNLVNDNRMKWFFFKNEYLIPFLDKVTFGVFTWKVEKFDDEGFHQACLVSEAFQNQDKMPLQNPLPTLILTNWLVLSLSFSRLRYVKGYDLLFNNLCFKQFRKAEEYFAKYLSTLEEKYLDEMIAWLYIEDNIELWVALTQHYTDLRIKKIAKIDKAYKKTIFNNYYVNRKAVISLYKSLYKQDGKKVEAKFDPWKVKFDFEKSLRAVAGNVNKYEDTDLKPAHNVLAFLNDAAEEAQKILEQQQKK